MKHHLLCEAPICAGDINPDFKKEVLWYAGEQICSKTPYAKFQQKQMQINREVKRNAFKNLDLPYTAHELETKSI